MNYIARYIATYLYYYGDRTHNLTLKNYNIWYIFISRYILFLYLDVFYYSSKYYNFFSDDSKYNLE